MNATRSPDDRRRATPRGVATALSIGLGVAVLAGLPLTGCAEWRAPTRAVGAVVEDRTIVDTIRARLAATADLDPTGIDVAASAGTVVLSGTSRTALAKSTAESIAVKVPGVRGVRNEIAVQP